MKRVTEYWDNGNIKKEEWFNSKGEKHSVDGPAYQSWYENGQKYIESWYFDGKLHRTDGHAISPEENVYYYKNNKKRRATTDGPAYQSWYENGQKSIESWYFDGKLHRTDGHAIRICFENGQKSYESWYLDGKEYIESEYKTELEKRSNKSKIIIIDGKEISEDTVKMALKKYFNF
jgi:hypothetical protein